MKTYNNFNEMFNAQSGTMNVGIFNALIHPNLINSRIMQFTEWYTRERLAINRFSETASTDEMLDATADFYERSATELAGAMAECCTSADDFEQIKQIFISKLTKFHNSAGLDKYPLVVMSCSDQIVKDLFLKYKERV